MNERTIQIDVIGKIEGTQFMKCKLYTNENIVIIMMNEFDYERLKEEGIFIRVASEPLYIVGTVSPSDRYISSSQRYGYSPRRYR